MGLNSFLDDQYQLEIIVVYHYMQNKKKLTRKSSVKVKKMNLETKIIWRQV